MPEAMEVEDYINSADDPWSLKKTGLIQERAEMIRKEISGRNVLDVGGGFGFYSEFLRKNGSDTICMDKSEKMVSEGKKMFQELQFVMADAVKMPFRDEKFDFMLCMGTLIYIEEKDSFFLEARRVLKPNGRILIYERNRNSFLHKFVRIFKNTEKEADNPNDFMSIKDIKKLSDDNNFIILKSGGSYSDFVFALMEKKGA